MNGDFDGLVDVIWRGFSSSPFIDITRRDAESIAATVLSSDWFTAQLADVWDEGDDNDGAKNGCGSSVNPYRKASA